MSKGAPFGPGSRPSDRAADGVSPVPASIPSADYFPAVTQGVQRLMELDREAGGDLCVAIGKMRAVECGIGRNNVAPIWRCGVSDTISAVDVLLNEWRKGKLRSRREAAKEIDDALQAIHDARLERKPGTYAEACEAGDVLRGAAASAIEARRAETQSGSVHESAVAKPDAQTTPSSCSTGREKP